MVVVDHDGSSAKAERGAAPRSGGHPARRGSWGARVLSSRVLAVLAILLLCPWGDVSTTSPLFAGAQGIAVLPDPPSPFSGGLLEGGDRTDCPHLASGLSSWHSSSMWGGSGVPTAGANVVLPSNARVVITQTINFVLGKITIPVGSELIVGENAAGIELTTTGIEVLGQLTIGSETCRIETKVTITLVGSRPANAVASPPAPTYKGILVDGTLSLHGKRYYQTWTRLAATVLPGNTTLSLKRPVNWEPGQQIVLVTSSMHDVRGHHQNEVLTIASVIDNGSGGSIVQVTSPVQYRHTANAYYQVEVGLLTRTILIQGSASDSEPSDPDPGNCLFAQCGQWYQMYQVPQTCTNSELTGFGGHVQVRMNGTGFVEGVELYRMGQTNVLGRYPMHFHLLEACPTCYFRDSSVHRSFYRCISIHGTHNATISENVAYDVIGYCYYLEDGVEQYNTLSHNLAAHVHTLGPNIATGCWGQTIDPYNQSSAMILPADVTASGFYITNIRNYIVGNAASGGWSGFAFPSLASPIGLHKDVDNMRPSNALHLKLDGNTAHSTGLWWTHSGAFYFGGALYYVEPNKLQYNPGRSFEWERDKREPCKLNKCKNFTCGWCPWGQMSWTRMTNTKAFLTAGVGLNSWTGPMEIIKYEAHDSRLALESLSGEGFWIDKMLVVCRTGAPLGLPSGTPSTNVEGSGFTWYDTGQSHIITNTEFRNCGYRSEAYNQYDTSPTRGCANNVNTGCSDDSSVFGFLTHSDEFTPEIMQGTKNITFTKCGRRFLFSVFNPPNGTVSGRGQNWLDTDGSVSGFREPTLIGSGFDSVSSWWRVDDKVFVDTQAPLVFIRQNGGPKRSIGHFHMEWDENLTAAIGNTQCGNGDGLPCPPLGYIRHLGYKFSPFRNVTAKKGLWVTANADVVGPIGGFGWHLKLSAGAPRVLKITEMEISPTSSLLFSIAYPVGTTITITAEADWCDADADYTCVEVFKKVASVAAVRSSLGNTYHLSSTGVLTFRIIEFANYYTGNPTWSLPQYNTPNRDYPNAFSLPRFERAGVRLPNAVDGNIITIRAKCAGNGTYCQGSVANYDPNVCAAGYVQVAYDKCCSTANLKNCVFSDGSTTTNG